MFEEMTVAKMYNLNETIAKDIFEGVSLRIVNFFY